MDMCTLVTDHVRQTSAWRLEKLAEFSDDRNRSASEMLYSLADDIDRMDGSDHLSALGSFETEPERFFEKLSELTKAVGFTYFPSGKQFLRDLVA